MDRAWRAARAAADQASALSAYREAMTLRAAAVEAHRRSADGDEERRFELLLELADDASRAAWWSEVERASFDAITLGRAMGSPARVGEAAAVLTRYCAWLPHEPEVVFEDVIDDLRWALAHVAPEDHATRARLMLVLAVELYYVPDTAAERRALLEAGLALARGEHDPALLWWACRTAWMGAWAPHLLDLREPWAAEGLAAARQAGDPAGVAVTTLVMALDALERADLEAWTRLSEDAGRLADRERLPYVSISLQWLRMTLAGLRGEREEVARQYAAMSETAPLVAIPMKDAQAPAAELLSRIWDRDALRGKVDELLAAFRNMFGTATVTHVMLARGRPRRGGAAAAVAQPHAPGDRRLLVDRQRLGVRDRGGGAGRGSCVGDARPGAAAPVRRSHLDRRRLGRQRAGGRVPRTCWRRSSATRPPPPDRPTRRWRRRRSGASRRTSGGCANGVTGRASEPTVELARMVA